jgi:uncharacterized protein YwgA
MTRIDWTLLVIAAAGGRAVQPVHLQKALFLLRRNLGLEELRVTEFYDFEPYDYGPFDGAVYSDAESLATEGMVEIDYPPDKRYREYRATERGLRHAQALRLGLTPHAAQYLDKVVRWVQSVSFNQLVEAIYKAYPDMAANSVFHRSRGAVS